jgi:hypothetical protein
MSPPLPDRMPPLLPGRKPFNGFRMYGFACLAKDGARDDARDDFKFPMCGVACLAKDDAKDDFKDDFKDSEWLATSFYVTICQ